MGQCVETSTADAGLEIPLRPGVTFPNWSVVASGTVRQALETILASSSVKDRWSGITDLEDRVYRSVLRHFAQTGHATSVPQISASTGMARPDVVALLKSLDLRDLIILAENGSRIVGAYPFTERNTGHRVHLGGHALNAMCAIDALGAGAMCGKDTTIESECRACGSAIHVATQNLGSALKAHTPAGAVVWSGIDYSGGCAATSLCTTMVFFCSVDHLQTWRKGDNSTATGFRLTMDEGLQAGMALFIPRLASEICDS